jgi:hypothetical protein
MGSADSPSGSHDAWAGGSRGTLWTQLIDVMLDRRHPNRDGLWREFLARYERPITNCMRARLAEQGRQDRTEEFVGDFIADMCAGAVLRTADRSKGRFRCYLQVAIRFYVAHEARTGKRLLQVEVGALEALADHRDPIDEIDHEHDLAYGIGLVQQALARLHAENPGLARAIAMRYGIRCEFWAGGPEAKSPAIAEALAVDTASTARGRLQSGLDKLRAMLRFDIAQTIHGDDRAGFETAFVDERDVIERCIEEGFPGLLTETTDD